MIPLAFRAPHPAATIFGHAVRAHRMLADGCRRYVNVYEDASVPGGIRYGGAASLSRKEADAVAEVFSCGNGLRRLYVLKIAGKGAAPAVMVPKFPRIMPPLGDTVSA